MIPVSSPRAPGSRTDARRNRALIVEAATAAFSAGDGAVRLEDVARAAGVGVGTLYRNFPSREALLEEVYRSDLGRVCDSATTLLAGRPADEALRRWMGRYAEFVERKRGMAEALRAVISSGAITSANTRELLAGAVQAILDAGADDGTLRADVPAADVVAGMAGVMSGASSPEQADRLLDLLVAALRRTA